MTNMENKRRAGKVKLTEQEVRDLKKLRRMGAGYRFLGEFYGVRPDHIQDICQGKYWKGIE